MPTPDDYNNNQPGLLQRGPTSLLPPIPPPPTNDNDPTKTQEAAVPRVPPPTPRNDRQPTPGDTQPPPPTPQQAPYTPVPWHAQQPPPAPPEPPLGNWTPDQVAPWLKAHLPTIPGSLVPNRPPDGYRGNQPVYNLRPGEPGYTAGGNSNILTGAVSWLESRNNGPFGDPSTLGQKAAFQAQYGAGPQGVTNYAQQLLRANPNATFGDFYAGYALGTGDPRRAPTIEDLRTRYPEAYKNLVTNFPATAGGGGALPGTPSGPQGPWTQANLEPNFAERTGQLGQPGNVPLTNVTSPNGQSWQVNQRVAPQFQGFLNDLYKAGYTGMVSSGGYANRPIRGGTIPSEHAYGAAIDIGAAHNPLQYVSAGGALKTDLPSNVGDIAAKWGLKWGGTFHDRQDPMHFEVAALMTPEQIQAAQNGAVTTAPQGTRVNAGAIGINTPLSTLLGSTVAAPPQQYIPPQPREPQHWGRTPEHDWTPGRMPTSHDIPNILGALLPIAIAGVLGGGGLGMIAAYAGYQNARNKGQLEEAKEQRTRWRDQLAETEAGLKEELLESSGLMAEFGNDFTSPASKAAWSELANKYQDQQLGAALESGNYAAVEALFKKRDEAFQSISKVSAASTKAEEQEQQREKDKSDEAAMGFPGSTGGGGTGAAPAGPEKPWENLGPGFAGGGQPAAPPPTPSGGPGAGAQPGSEPPAPQPAAAPTPSEQPATDEPAPEPAPPGTPSATLPPVDVNAPEPAPPPTAGAPRTPFDAMVSQVVNGEEVEKFKPSIPADGLRKLQAAAADKINRIEAVKAGPNAAAQLKAIDPTFGNYAEGVANYTMPDPTSRANVGRDYVARMYAAAQKINPQWNYQDFTTKQEFRTSFNPDKNVGKTLSRTSRLVNLSRELSDDAQHLPNTNVASFNSLIAWFQGGKIGDARYTKFITDWRLFANEAQAVASGTGTPPVTLTSHLIDTLQQGATPQMIRQGLKEDLQAALGSIDPNLSGWHRQFPGQANPAMFDQGVYSELNQYAHMNIDTGAVPEALPEVGYSQEWGGQRHYYLGGDITNKLNWSTQKPPGGQ